MCFVFQFVLRVDEDVVEVGRTEVVKVIQKDIVHVSLVRRRSVRKAKGKYLALVRSVSSSKGGQVLRVRVHSNPVKRLADIQFRKDPGPAESRERLVD